jgi:hypothetical protein
MSDRPYLQHGIRHGVNGTDPIPNLGQVPFAALHNNQSTGTTITSGSTAVYISMEGGSGGSVFETSDTTVFSNAQGSGLPGDPWGIKCLQNGTYLVSENYFVSGGTGGVTINTYHTLTGGNTVCFYQPGRTHALVGDTWDVAAPGVHLFFSELSDATDANPAPIYINPYAEVASGSSVTVKMQTFVRYLGPYAGGNI